MTCCYLADAHSSPKTQTLGSATYLGRAGHAAEGIDGSHPQLGGQVKVQQAPVQFGYHPLGVTRVANTLQGSQNLKYTRR